VADVKALAEKRPSKPTYRASLREHIAPEAQGMFDALCEWEDQLLDFTTKLVTRADALLAEVDRERATANMRWGMVLAARERAVAAEAEVVRLRELLAHHREEFIRECHRQGVEPDECLADFEAEVAAAGSPTAWVCPSCGTSWVERLLVGAIGCPECGSVVVSLAEEET